MKKKNLFYYYYSNYYTTTLYWKSWLPEQFFYQIFFYLCTTHFLKNVKKVADFLLNTILLLPNTHY